MILCENTGRKPWFCKCPSCVTTRTGTVEQLAVGRDGGISVPDAAASLTKLTNDLARANPVDTIRDAVGPNADADSFARAARELEKPLGLASAALRKLGIEISMVSEKLRTVIFAIVRVEHRHWLSNEYHLYEAGDHFKVSDGRRGFSISARHVADRLNLEDRHPCWNDLAHLQPRDHEMEGATIVTNAHLRAAAKKFFEQHAPCKIEGDFVVYELAALDMYVIEPKGLPKVRIATNALMVEVRKPKSLWDDEHLERCTKELMDSMDPAAFRRHIHGDWDIRKEHEEQMREPPPPRKALRNPDKWDLPDDTMYGDTLPNARCVALPGDGTLKSSPVQTSFTINVEKSYDGEINGHEVKLRTEGSQLWIMSPLGRFRLA